MTNVPFNQKKFVSPVNEIGTLASLNQTMVVGQGNKRQQVDASFNAKKNQTIIKVQRSQEEKDHDHEHANEDPKPIIKAGLDLLRMLTSISNSRFPSRRAIS